jgi:hypothetical protein
MRNSKYCLTYTTLFQIGLPMKKTMLYLVFVSVSLSTFFSSCSRQKEETAPAPDFSATPAMDGTIGGVAWQASSLNASLNTLGTQQELVINGWQQSTDQTVYLVVHPYNLATGTFYFAPGQENRAFYRLGSTTVDSSDYAKSGRIVIYSTGADTVKGTYDFTTVKNVTVSGKFTVIPFK